MRNRLIFLVILFFTSNMLLAKNRLQLKDNNYLFASIFNSTHLTGSLPSSFSVNNGMLKYIPEFLEKNTLSPTLKDYIEKNDWIYISSFSPSSFLKENRIVRMKALKNSLNPNLTFSSTANYNYTLSPPLFSKDNKRAFVISQTNSNNEVLTVTVYFFEMKNGVWSLITQIIPYLI